MQNLNPASPRLVGDSVWGEGLDPTIDADGESSEHQVLRKLLLSSKHGELILTRCDAALKLEDDCCIVNEEIKDKNYEELRLFVICEIV